MTRASTRNSMIAELQKEYQELSSSPAAITQSSSLPDLLSPTKSRLVSPGMRSKSPISFHMNRASSRNSLIAELQKEYQKLSSSSASIIKASSSPELLSSTTFLKPPLSPDRHLPPKSPRSFHSESSTITKVCSSSPEILNITKPPISKSILSDDIDPLPIKASLILQFARSRNGVVTEVEKEYKRKSKAARAEKMETSLEVEREEKSLSLKTEEKERKKKLEQLRRQQEESIRKKAELANLQKLKLEPPKIKEWYRFQQAQEESEEEQEVMTRLTKVRDKAEIQRQLQLQIQQAEEEVKHMRRIRVTKEKLLKMEQQLLRIEQETDIEKERMRNEFEKTKEHARKDIVLRLDAMRAVQERKRVLEDLRIQVELENEQKNLKAIIKEIEPMISELKKQNVRRSGENMEISVMFEGLNEHAKLKTREKKALLDEQKQLVKMCDEAISLSAEPKLKQIFRKGVYKCAQGAIESDLYDHCLCEKIKKVIRDTESKLGCEALILDRPSTFTRQFHNSFNGLHPIVEDDESSGSGEVDNYLEFDIREFATEVDKQLAGLNRLSTVVDTKQLSTLYENKDLLKAIFQFMDKEANGTVDLEEFQVGIDLLNRRLPDDTQFEDPVGLFKALDLDGNGKLDIDDEFNFVFMQNAETSEYCWGESTSSLQHPFY